MAPADFAHDGAAAAPHTPALICKKTLGWAHHQGDPVQAILLTARTPDLPIPGGSLIPGIITAGEIQRFSGEHLPELMLSALRELAVWLVEVADSGHGNGDAFPVRHLRDGAHLWICAYREVEAADFARVNGVHVRPDYRYAGRHVLEGFHGSVWARLALSVWP